MGKLVVYNLAQRYTCSLRLRLSKNYQSIEVGAEFGRNAHDDESMEQLVASVNEATWNQLHGLAKTGAEVLISATKSQTGGH